MQAFKYLGVLAVAAALSASAADIDITAEAITLAEPYLAGEPQGAINLANHWLRLARRSGAALHFQRAEELALEASEHADLAVPSWHVRAAIAAARGDLAAAESLYRQILTQDPQDVLALNNFAFALVQTEERCKEAANFSARAMALAPENPQILDTHARALACRGNFAEAESAVRQALSNVSNDPGIVLTLVRILIAESRFTEAENELDRAETLLRRTARADARWAEATALREHLQFRED